MKRWLIILALTILLCAGCATVPPCPVAEKCVCPNQTVVIPVQSPYGTLYVPIPKGSLDDPKNWLTEEQFRKKIEEYEWEKKLEKGY